MKKHYELSVTYDSISVHKEYLELCKYIYHKDTDLPKGYKVIDIFKDSNGFYAEAVRKGNNIVIVSRGSNDFFDAYIDLLIPQGRTPSQYYSLMKAYHKVNKIRNVEPNVTITFTGHSLGGTISDLASVSTGENAVSFAPFGAEKLLPTNVKKLPSYVIDYGNEDDFVFTSKLNQQMGEVRIVPPINDEWSHKLENWGDIGEYFLYAKTGAPFVNADDISLIKRYREYLEKHNLRFNSNNTDKTSCVGSYPVSGYTRSDGTEVSSYVRTCGAKHTKGKYSKTSKSILDLPKEEMDYWVRLLV